MRRLALATVGVTALALASPLPTASAAACTGSVRYASSTNTVYLRAGEMSLPDLVAVCPAVPLKQVDPATRTWQLNADLVVQSGAVLHIRGARASTPGRVDHLRLVSAADNLPQHVASITAQYGTITIESTAVTSWDPAAGGPDTNPAVPGAGGATPPAGVEGRAFIRALSFLDPAGGTPRRSRMDIVNSDLGYLGWYSPESYGVAYKARGCDAAHPSVCARLTVLGSQRGSHFHHNEMGTYTFGARDMVFDGNEYDHNVMYGLDPHDDSDHLTITRNHFHHNGNHGLICSKRCDHLRIANNESDHNGSTAAGAPMAHGIMIHSGVTDSVIENNRVHDQSGAGIAVHDGLRNVIRNNTLQNNFDGIRISVGSRDLTLTGNRITGSRDYAVYSYPGVDRPVYGIPSGRPTNNVFTGNTFDAAGRGLAYLGSSDRTRFVDSQILGGTGRLVLNAAPGTVWQGRTLPATGTFSVASASPA
jgi:parallel beta-helix repeat protein